MPRFESESRNHKTIGIDREVLEAAHDWFYHRLAEALTGQKNIQRMEDIDQTALGNDAETRERFEAFVKNPPTTNIGGFQIEPCWSPRMSLAKAIGDIDGDAFALRFERNSNGNHITLTLSEVEAEL